MKSINWVKMLPVVLTLFIFGGLLIAFLLIPEVRMFMREAWNILTSEDRQLISDWVSQFGIFGIIILLLFFLVQMFIFILPSWFLIVVSVLAYGPVMGGVIALGGIALAATAAYWIGHFFGDLTIHKIIDKKNEEKMKTYLDRYEFWLVVIFRLAPFLSDDIISYIAGLTFMSYSRFILATIIGSSPLIAVIAYLGETNERLFNGFIIISIICIISFIGYVWWDRRQQSKLLPSKAHR